MYHKKRAKYNTAKTIYEGITFDSKKERNRYIELRQMEADGKICELELQKKYMLIPAQYAETSEVYVRGKNKGEKKRGQLIERAVYYVADFVYRDIGTDKLVVEDVKGYRDPASAGYAKYILKRKLMLFTFGIRIREI